MCNHMNNDQFNKAIQDIRNVSLTHAEKQAMLKHIISHHSHAHKPVKSPWSIFSFQVWVEHRGLSVALAALVLIIVGAGGSVFAAGRALPGDAFYAMKTHIVEPLRVALATSPQAKAEVASDLATTRLQEAETLAAQGNLDLPKQQEIDILLNKHVSELTGALAQADSTDAAESVRTKFKTNMNAHARLLDVISQEASTSTEKDEIAQVARSVRAKGRFGDSQTSAGIALTAMMTAPEATTVAPVPSDMGISAKGAKKNTSQSREKFNKKKKSVQLLIQETHADIMQLGADTTPLQRSIASNTIDTLDQASSSLMTADQQVEQGDDEAADATLKQSEETAAEAQILLRAGLKIRGKGHNRF